MTTLPSRRGLPAPIKTVDAAQQPPALLSLWQHFRHHLSATSGTLPALDGRYSDERIRATVEGEPGSRAWLLTAGDSPIGFAAARALDQPTAVLSSFFLVAPARRQGIGREFASAVLAGRPGRWTVAYQPDNDSAARFWPQVVAKIARDCEESTTVSRSRGRDVWITFTV